MLKNTTSTTFVSATFANNKIDIPCIILCGGKSERMGEPKAFLRFGDLNLLEFQILKYKEIFNEIFISTKDNELGQKMAKIAQEMGVKVIFDSIDSINFKDIESKNDKTSTNLANSAILKNLDSMNFEFKNRRKKDPNFSPIFALLTCANTLKSDFFTICIDCPFLEQKSIEKLYENFKQKNITTIAYNSQKHALLGFYKAEILEILKQNIELNNFRLISFLEQISHNLVEIPSEESQNLNTQEEYKIALTKI